MHQSISTFVISVAPNNFVTTTVSRLSFPLASSSTSSSDEAVTTSPTIPDPIIKSKSAIIIDEGSGKIIFAKNKDEKLSIASLTKLMTAMIFLENKNVSWEQMVSFQKENLQEPSWIKVQPGDQILVTDLFNAVLAASANDAASLLSRLIQEPEKFVDLMNQKSKSLGLKNTFFVEPTGLNPQNISTAADLAVLIREAVQKPEIKQALNVQKMKIKIIRPDKTYYFRFLNNTNKLLGLPGEIYNAKTGFVEESGYCLAGVDSVNNNRFNIVVLGASTSEARFEEAKILSDWAGKKQALQCAAQRSLP